MDEKAPVTNHQKASKESCSLEEFIDIKALDWNLVWQAKRAKKNSSKRDARFWDGRAASFAKAASGTDYADQFLAIMKPEAHWTVLDMGCGSGVLALPLARLTSSVTAVDFSAEMLAIVRRQCETEGISNITTINGRWEDNWEKLGIGTHDAAIASRSMNVDDLHSSIMKLNAVARKCVYIVALVGDGPFDRRLFEAVGRPLNLGPDYIYNYNMLYQEGILANVAFIEHKRRRTYDNPDNACASMKWMFGELNPDEEKRLNDYVKTRLVFRSGSWSFPYEQTVRWAVIWWNKENT